MIEPPPPARHSLAWLAWLLCALSIAWLTRNPFYLCLLWLSALCIYETLPAALPVSRPGLAPLGLSLFIIPIAALLNALSVHIGDAVLFRLPAGWPLVGGPITLEALVYGALNGLALCALLAVFAVFNKAVPAQALMRRVPRAFYPVAVVIGIAISFVPLTLRQIEQVRQAQAVRGHQMRRLRDGLALFLPVLVGGLERALQLAEAMTARGFAAAQPVFGLRERAVILGSVVLVIFGGLLPLFAPAPRWVGMGFIGLGVLALGWMLRAAGQQAPRTTLRKEDWRWPDTALALCALLPVLALTQYAPEVVAYYPYPALLWPRLALAHVLALAGLLAPLALAAWANRSRFSS